MMNHMECTTLMLRTNLHDYSDQYILFKGTITVPNSETTAPPDNRNKKSTI